MLRSPGRCSARRSSQTASIDRPIEFDEGAIGPQTTTKFLARDDPSAAVEECEQNPHRLFA